MIWPWVLSHSVIIDGAPCAAKWIAFEISPSFMALGPATLAQIHLKAGKPGLRGVLFDQASFSITISGRKLTPYCWATVISFTSARLFVVDANDSAMQSASDVRETSWIPPRIGSFSERFLIAV